jgi:hypothetical protein
MRRSSCLAALAAILAALGLMAAESVDAKGRRCARAGTVTLASTSAARIFRPTGATSYRLYGCLKSVDRAYRLDHNSAGAHRWTFGKVPALDPAYPSKPGARAWYFAGRFAGVWARSSRGPELWVYDLRSGRMAVRLTQFHLPDLPGEAAGVRYGPLLATNGVPVWLNYYTGVSGGSQVSGCMDTGTSAWYRPCRLAPERVAFPPPYLQAAQVSEYSRKINGLRVSGTLARWRSAGAARSRSLVFLGA